MLSRKLIYIIFASLIFAGELEVDGDLTVTGNIQNQTIDSLLQVIADLQSQMDLLQQNSTNIPIIHKKLIEIDGMYNGDNIIYNLQNPAGALLLGVRTEVYSLGETGNAGYFSNLSIHFSGESLGQKYLMTVPVHMTEHIGVITTNYSYKWSDFSSSLLTAATSNGNPSPMGAMVYAPLELTDANTTINIEGTSKESFYYIDGFVEITYITSFMED